MDLLRALIDLRNQFTFRHSSHKLPWFPTYRSAVASRLVAAHLSAHVRWKNQLVRSGP
jgi:hypothetical protein